MPEGGCRRASWHGNLCRYRYLLDSASPSHLKHLGRMANFLITKRRKCDHLLGAFRNPRIRCGKATMILCNPTLNSVHLWAVFWFFASSSSAKPHPQNFAHGCSQPELWNRRLVVGISWLIQSEPAPANIVSIHLGLTFGNTWLAIHEELQSSQLQYLNNFYR